MKYKHLFFDLDHTLWDFDTASEQTWRRLFGQYDLSSMGIDGFEETQREKLRHAGIEEYFSEIITSERSNSMKPHPEIFHYALQTTGAACPDCLMIGDALDIDVLGAMQIGMDCVYYNPQRKPH